MNRFSISSDYRSLFGMEREATTEEAVLEFLKKRQAKDMAYLYSVHEYDDEDDLVEMMNGEEWLRERRALE